MSDLTLDFVHGAHMIIMSSETGISIDQDGEWDLSLFDELDSLGNTDELLQALEHTVYTGAEHGLDFDFDLPAWGTDTGSSTESERSVNSLSPAHTLSSVPSPASGDVLSPYSIPDEALSPQPQPSPVSVCSESSGFSDGPPPAKRTPRRGSQPTRVKAQPVKRPLQPSPRVSIQPKPVLTAVPLAHAAPLQAKTIILQPLQTAVQTAVLPTVLKQAPLNIQPAPGRPLVLSHSQPAQVLQIQATHGSVAGHVVTMPTLTRVGPNPVAAARPALSATLRCPSDEDDSKACSRQQRMMKNRESACLSRRKKKEYLLTLEARLKTALSENLTLKSENGTLKRQLEGLLTQNTVLKTTAPKRRAVCLMALLLLLVLNIGPMGVFDGGSGSGSQAGSMPSGRHLLGFSPDGEAELDPEPPQTSPPQPDHRLEDKALMVVKDPAFLRPLPLCQTPVNRTKCMELNQELRGWVHRHEVEQTRSRRLSNSQHRPARTIQQKAHDKEADVGHIVTVQYTDTSEDKSPGSELQVYYAPHRTYGQLFEEIHRRGDTFYVVSFRRDHLLLPATSHIKGRRPKMTVVLPAMNINDSVINDQDFEVMMQIDCEVTDTRILHIKASSIPPFLRVNRTDALYPSSPAAAQATPPHAALMGSA